jgi:hypothetical protein
MTETQPDYYPTPSQRAPAAKAALSAAMVGGLLAIFSDASTRDLVEAHDGDNWKTAKR